MEGGGSPKGHKPHAVTMARETKEEKHEPSNIDLGASPVNGRG